MKMKKWTGLLILCMLILSVANVKAVKAAEVYSKTSSEYVNPMYQELNNSLTNSNTFENSPELAGSNAQTFSTVNEASNYLREKMVDRVSVISMTINTSYYRGLDKYIFDLAVSESNSSGSSEGDYLYAHFLSCRTSASYTSNQVTIQYQMTYLSSYEQEQAVNSTVRSVLNNLNVYNKDEYTKIKAVHDYIVQNIKYDYNFQKYSAYNAIVEKDVVCQGFASLTYKMLKDLGVGVRFIGGMGNGGKHAWNIVRINGKWYNTDNTWDENTTSISNISYEYFLKSNNDFTDHIRDPEYDGSLFNQKYPMASSSYIYDPTAVTVGIPVSSISLNVKSLNLQAGNQGKFTASVLPSDATNQEVKWESSDTKVATVDENGNVTAAGAGTATITCTASDGSGQTVAGTVMVTGGTQVQLVKVTSLILNQRNLNFTIGKTGQLIATILPRNATNQEVRWESSDTSVATVDENGNVTAVGAGTTIITCKTSDGSNKSAACIMKVTDGRIKVSSIRLNQRNLNWAIGKTGKLIATISPRNATNQEVGWESSDVSVATVDENGNVTAVGVGIAKITCIANDGSNKSVTCTIKVTDEKVKVSSIRLNQKNLNLIIEKTGKLIASISPRNATNKDVIWESSDVSVATVDENGNVTAVGVGTAQITCTSNDGSNKSVTCTVKVTDGKVRVSSIRLNQRNLNWILGKTGKLVATISPRNATNKEVTWESSDINVATVDENGNVTAVGVGTAKIICMANDGSDKNAICSIRVNN